MPHTVSRRKNKQITTRLIQVSKIHSETPPAMTYCAHSVAPLVSLPHYAVVPTRYSACACQTHTSAVAYPRARLTQDRRHTPSDEEVTREWAGNQAQLVEARQILVPLPVRHHRGPRARHQARHHLLCQVDDWRQGRVDQAT